MRALLIAMFAVVLALSTALAMGSGPVGGWMVSALVSTAGLAWVVWGEPEVKPIAAPYTPPPAPIAPKPVLEPWQRHFLAQTAQAILRIDGKLAVSYANAAAERLFGYGEGQLTGVALAELFPAAARLDQGDPGHLRERARRKDGSRVPVELAVTRVTSSDPAAGHVEATVLTAREVVEPGKIEPAEEAGRLFEDYFKLAPVPMVVLNRDGHVERMNRAAEEATEFAAAELRRQPYWEVFLEEVSAPEARRDWESILALREAAPVRQTWKTRMGGQLRLDWRRTVLRDDFGQAASVLAVGLPAVSQGASLDVMALADQLTAVNGYSEYLLMSVPREDPIRADLESIHRAGLAASGHIRREAA